MVRRRRRRRRRAAIAPRAAMEQSRPPRPTEAAADADADADGRHGERLRLADGRARDGHGPPVRHRRAPPMAPPARATGSAASAHRVAPRDLPVVRAPPLASARAADAAADVPRDMPPIANPPPPVVRGLRPGGTMPPPMAPLPRRSRPRRRSDDGASRTSRRRAPMPAPVATLPPPAAAVRAGAAAVRAACAPIAAARPTPSSRRRRSCRCRTRTRAASSSAQGAKKIVGRPLSVPSKRGVQLEPLDPKVVKMLDLQSNILERLRAKLDLDKIPMDRLHEEDLWQKRRARDDRSRRDARDLGRAAEVHRSGLADQGDAQRGARARAARGPARGRRDRRDLDRSARPRRRRQERRAARLGQGVLVGRRVRARRQAARPRGGLGDRRASSGRRSAHARRHAADRRGVAGRGARRVPRAEEAGGDDAVAVGPRRRRTRCRRGMADFLATCIAARRNMLVCGGPGSGKTSLVAALASASPAGERVVSVEEVAELAIARDEWIQLEIASGTASVTTTSTWRRCSRRRCGFMPDRLVVGEVRGREALPLVHALNASVDGAVVAMTGEGANAALNRLATLARGRPRSAATARSASSSRARSRSSSTSRVTPTARSRSTRSKRSSASRTRTFETQTVFAFQNNDFVADRHRAALLLGARGARHPGRSSRVQVSCFARSRTSRSRGHTARSSSTGPSRSLIAGGEPLARALDLALLELGREQATPSSPLARAPCRRRHAPRAARPATRSSRPADAGCPRPLRPPSAPRQSRRRPRRPSPTRARDRATPTRTPDRRRRLARAGCARPRRRLARGGPARVASAGRARPHRA